MEDAIYLNTNLTDEETLQLPEGEALVKEDYPSEDHLQEIEERTAAQIRKASIGCVTNQLSKENSEEDERWRREIESEIENGWIETTVQLIEKEDYKYLGEVKNDLREGFGVCYYKNGNVYKGCWRNDKRQGWGILTLENGEIFMGELLDDNFSGYCEHINSSHNFSMHGTFLDNKFVDVAVVKNDSCVFEGEVLSENSSISIGQLTSSKKPSKIFLGKVYNYKEENGLGIFLNLNNSTMYLGEIRNKLFENYIEMFNLDGTAYFSFIQRSLKYGYHISFSKDGRVCLGKFIDNYKHGPFMTFSNCHNIAKSSVRTEIFHLDFKSKVVDKMEPSKKYLMLNYPEFSSILAINYTEIIAKLNEVIVEEVAYLNSKIPKEEKNE